MIDVAAGIVRPPLNLVRTYKGKEVRARIEPDGRIRFGDKVVDSLSMAGSLAKASVSGKVRGKYPAAAGWAFWRYADEAGRLRPVDALRQRFLQRSG